MRSSLLFVLVLAVTIVDVRSDDPAKDPPKADDPKDPPKADDPEVCDCDDEVAADICEVFAKVEENCKLESAMKCAKSCKRCCELKRFDCKDKTGDAPVECKSIKEFGWCENSVEPMKSMVNEWCEHTCGKCCKDDDEKLCKYAKSDCKNPKTQNKCRKTCEMCNTDGCMDVYDNCDSMKASCKDAKLGDMMTKVCNKTCGICGGGGSGPPPKPCTDGKTGCEAWVKNGFCTSPSYTDAIKLEYCAKSCNLC